MKYPVNGNTRTLGASIMSKLLSILLLLVMILTSCDNQNTSANKSTNNQNGSSKSDTPQNMLTETEIIDHVKKAINPKFKDWVLFSNGTYIILEDTAIKDKVEEAHKIMKEYGPVYAGGPAGDMAITKLTYTDGWVVSGHYYGMYTYVHPKQLEQMGITDPSDLDVGLVGRQCRGKDGKELKCIYVHK